MTRPDLTAIRPFEICSVRPPTENSSLTFRLTRNCHWNRCAFCPVYKFDAAFKKRALPEILEDVARAKRLDDAMFDYGIGYPLYSEADFGRAASFLDDIRREQWEAGILDDETETSTMEDGDPSVAWFRQWFRDRPTLEDSIRHILSWRIGGSKTCFLGDSDSLIHKPPFMREVLEAVTWHFPTLERFTIYGRTKSAVSLRSANELRQFRDAGISRVHFGLESGSDQVLRLIQKGCTKAEHIEGLTKCREAGLSVSVYVMPGLGGAELSEVHALDTAHVINQSGPDFVRIRTLEVFPFTELARLRETGTFTEAEEDQVIREIGMLIGSINVETIIYSDSASNLLQLNGRLPSDRDRLLSIINSYLGMSPRERLEYSLNARLASFHGQYGGFSRELYTAISPVMKGGKLDAGGCTDDELRHIIRLARSRLMP